MRTFKKLTGEPLSMLVLGSPVGVLPLRGSCVQAWRRRRAAILQVELLLERLERTALGLRCKPDNEHDREHAEHG
jgi:hypothetical protein